MRTTRRTSQFKRDYKREKNGRYRETVDKDLQNVLTLLVADNPLPEHYQDHAMRRTNGLERNCHVRPDLILLYSKPNAEELVLIRLGSHSAIGV